MVTFWNMVKKALRGSDQDFTRGPLKPAILVLAFPMVLEMGMEGIFAIVDVFFLEKLGAAAVAAVGFTESILTIIYILAMGLSASITAIVARRVGEKNYAAAGKSAVQSFLLTTIIAILLGVGGVIGAEFFLQIMGASPEILREGAPYFRIMFGSNIVILLLFVSNAVMRGAGDSHTAMRSLGLANLINIFLGPCLIFGLGPFPQLGLTGAAVATTIGRCTGMIYSFKQLIFGHGRLKLRRTDLSLNFPIMKSLLRLSASGVFQNFIGMASWIFMVKIIAPFGSSTVAGYTIAVRMVLFLVLPAIGLSNAAATLVGQSLGARNPERAEKSAWLTGFYNLCFLGGLGTLFTFFAPEIVGFYTEDPLIFASAKDGLRYMSAGLPFYAYGLVLTQAFNGAGDTRTPIFINFVAFWLFQIPLAYVLSTPLALGVRGACAAVGLSFCLDSIICVLLFRRGRWKLKEL